MSATPALLAASAGVGFGHAILPDHWVPLAVVGRTRRYPLAKVARLSGLAGVAHVLISIILGAVIIAVGLQFRSTVASAQDTIIGCLLIATGLGFAVFEIVGPGHSHDHEHGHGHGHDHEHEHGHAHGHRQGHDHEPGHDHGHGDEHGHDHEQGHDHGHGDEHGHDHEQGTDHEHEQGTDHEHAHEHAHAHGDEHRHAHDARGHHEARGVRGIASIMVPFGAAASPDLTILPVFLAATTAGVATAVGSVVIFATVTIGTIVGLTLAAVRGGYQIRGQWLERWGNALTAIVLIVIGALVLTGTV